MGQGLAGVWAGGGAGEWVGQGCGSGKKRGDNDVSGPCLQIHRQNSFVIITSNNCLNQRSVSRAVNQRELQRFHLDLPVNRHRVSDAQGCQRRTKRTPDQALFPFLDFVGFYRNLLCSRQCSPLWQELFYRCQHVPKYRR